MNLFFKKKEVYVPTLAGFLLLLLLFFFIIYILIKNTYSFLSPSHHPVSTTLVIEGWIPDEGLKNALAYFKRHHYRHMIITGVPITQWTYSSPFSNMADASAGTMKRLLFRDTIYRAIIPSTIQRDRTYSTFISMKSQLKEWGISSEHFDLYSMGAHARRSYLMFRKAFPDAQIGLITDTDASFDPEYWYASSRGFRTVFGELISYFYSALFFQPNEYETLKLIKHGRYLDGITNHRFETDREFADSLTSPLDQKAIDTFSGLSYFPIDTNWRIDATFVLDTNQAPFRMPTTTERLPLYRKYGEILFTKNDTTLRLTAYQNLDYLKKNPGYKKLFVPFKDLSNSKTTYGGGRYLDVDIPLDNKVKLDFNLAYNPYCAYHERWSCPLPPFENHLQISVHAGVKSYHSNH